MEVSLNWQRTWFDATNAQGVTIKMGPGLEDGPSPMEALLMAAGGCSGIDVAQILEKMRQPLQKMEIKVSGRRHDDHPRYFEEICLDFILTGDLEHNKVQRALNLSIEKYCSVVSSFAPKVKVDYRFEIRKGE